MEKKGKALTVLAIVSTVLAIMGGLTAIGLAMPWNGATRAELKAVEKTNIEEHDKIKESAGQQREAMSRMEGKIDIVVEFIKQQKQERRTRR